MRIVFFLAGLSSAIVALAGCSPQRALNAFVPDDGYRLSAGRAYGDHPRQRLDVYVPRAGALPAPVVVFFYGGRWSSGERAGYRFVAQALTERGYVAVVPDYRLYPEVRFPAFVEDGAAVVAWVRHHIGDYGGDPGQVFLMGHSAGAHIAAMLATDRRFLHAEGLAPTDLAGFVGLAGPYDFLPLKADDLRDMFGPPARFPASQPVRFVNGDEPPTLLVHGLDDGTVLPRNSRRLAAALEAAGVPVDTVFYPDAGHVRVVAALGSPLRFAAPVLTDVAAFLDRRAGRSVADD